MINISHCSSKRVLCRPRQNWKRDVPAVDMELIFFSLCSDVVLIFVCIFQSILPKTKVECCKAKIAIHETQSIFNTV